jgi:hypothetical protein
MAGMKLVPWSILQYVRAGENNLYPPLRDGHTHMLLMLLPISES